MITRPKYAKRKLQNSLQIQRRIQIQQRSEICLSWGQHFAVLVHMTNVLHTRAMVKGIQEWTK